MATRPTLVPNHTFERLNQMMEDFVGMEAIPTHWSTRAWSPSVDIHETDKEYQLLMDLPGFDQKNIEVEVLGNKLTLSGHREQNLDEVKDGKLIRYERNYGSFSRSFSLESEVIAKHIDAKFENGVLKVVIPKATKEAAKKIPVH